MFGVALKKTLLARNVATASEAGRVAAQAPTAVPSQQADFETPAPTTAPAPSQRKNAAIEIIGPPHEAAILAPTPPQNPVEEETSAVATQAEPPQAAQSGTEAAKPAVSKVCEKPSGMFGTSLFFAANPTEASKQAATQEKLVFLLHVSGDFDDPGFT
jgi:hypothetical protein